MPGTLLKFRVPGIQTYIFETPHLKEIRGASALVEDFCNREMHDTISKAGGKPLYLAAGHGAVHISDPKKVSHVEAAIGQQITSRTHALRAFIASEPWRKNDAGPTLKTLDKTLARQIPLARPGPLMQSVLQNCKSCRRAPAVKFYARTKDLVCQACLLKRSRTGTGASLPYWTAFQNYLGKIPPSGVWQSLAASKSFHSHLAEDLNQIGSLAQRQGYVALIYADVNKLGKAVETFHDNLKASDATSLGFELDQFSKRIEAMMQAATFDAIVSTWPDLEPNEAGLTLFPFDILYLGGDDLLFVCAADKGVAFSTALLHAFENQRPLEGQQLSLSLGMVLAKAQTPMNALIGQAKQVLASAKQHAFELENSRTGSTQAIDFSVLTESSLLDLSNSRQLLGTGSGYRLMARPFSFPQFKTLLKSLDFLSNKKLRPVRFYPVLEACRRSALQGSVSMQALLARMEKSERQTTQKALGMCRGSFDSKTNQNKSTKPTQTATTTSEDMLWWRNSKGESETVLEDWLDLAPFIGAQGGAS